MGHQEALATIAALTFPDISASIVQAYCINQVDTVLGGTSDDWLVDLTRIEDAGPNNLTALNVLPLSTGGTPLRPWQRAEITATIQDPREFRARQLKISNAGTPGGAMDWMVNDIVFGNRSQLSQPGDLPGDLFASNAIDRYVTFETIQPQVDVVVTVTYIGLIENGVPFYGSLVGTFAGSEMPQYVRQLAPRHDIPAGFACVRRSTTSNEVSIFLPAIDDAVFSIALDSVLAAEGARTPEVDTVLDQMLEGRGGLVLEAYAAAVVQRAERLRAQEDMGT